VNLRELNHILIPRSAQTWERLENSRLVRLLGPLPEMARSLTTEGQVVFVAMLVAGAAGIDVRFSHLYLVFCGLVGLLMAGYACRPMARLPGVSVRVDHPPRVAVGETLAFTVTVRNDGPRTVYAIRVRGPFLPWDGLWVGPAPSVPCLAPGEEARVTISACFLRRGEHWLGRFRAVSVRPLGLVSGPRVSSAPVILTVVPKVPEVAGLRPARGRARMGERAARAPLAGESFELLGVRPYRPGDRIRDLHARSWARVGAPIVREYRRPAFERVAVALYPAAPRAGREGFDAAVALAAGLVARLAREEAQVDLHVLADPPRAVTVGPRGGHVEPALDLLAAAEEGAAGPSAALEAEAERCAAVYVVAAAWSEGLGALVDRLRRRGTDVRPYVVLRREVALPEARVVRASELDAPEVWLP
jgi:uncharacterized protein (DUF58 family)